VSAPLSTSSLRLAKDLVGAIRARADILAPAIDALDHADTEHEQVIAAGNLLAAAALADRVYRERTERAASLLAAVDTEHVDITRWQDEHPVRTLAVHEFAITTPEDDAAYDADIAPLLEGTGLPTRCDDCGKRWHRIETRPLWVNEMPVGHTVEHTASSTKVHTLHCPVGHSQRIEKEAAPEQRCGSYCSQPLGHDGECDPMPRLP
jgi:hypothetical protein